MSIYWLDSGVLITAHRGPLAYDITPGFWTFLESHLRSGTIRMPKMSWDEISEGNDWLAKWCKERRNVGYFCCKTCDYPDVEQHQTVVADFVYANHTPASAAEFLKGADPWVIAFARATGGFIVTEELKRKYKSKIKIPHIAKVPPFRLPCKSTAEMCRELKAKFG